MSRRRIAGELMYKTANEDREFEDLIDNLLELCKRVREKGNVLHQADWTTHGLLRDFGWQIQENRGIRYSGK